MPSIYHHSRPVLLLLVILVSGCARPAPTIPPTQTLTAPTAIQSPVPATPTAIPEPLAVLVNGEGITLVEYQDELARYQNTPAATEDGLSPEEQSQIVLQDLIDQVLLAQAAQEAGFTVSDADLQSRLDRLAARSGGVEALAQWQANQGYTPDSFARALRRSIMAAWQRDRIVEAVPTIADQVHARQILVFNQADAERALTRLQSGVDFASLAILYDEVTSGNLGWFPMGYLTDPAVEQAAFALQPGEISPIVQSSVGYHILQVIERDPQHPLSPDARRMLQKNELSDWLDARRAQSQITVHLPASQASTD